MDPIFYILIVCRRILWLILVIFIVAMVVYTVRRQAIDMIDWVGAGVVCAVEWCYREEIFKIIPIYNPHAYWWERRLIPALLLILLLACAILNKIVCSGGILQNMKRLLLTFFDDISTTLFFILGWIVTACLAEEKAAKLASSFMIAITTIGTIVGNVFLVFVQQALSASPAIFNAAIALLINLILLPVLSASLLASFFCRSTSLLYETAEGRNLRPQLKSQVRPSVVPAYKGAVFQHPHVAFFVTCKKSSH